MYVNVLPVLVTKCGSCIVKFQTLACLSALNLGSGKHYEFLKGKTLTVTNDIGLKFADTDARDSDESDLDDLIG